jgi:hypothetical protein
VATERIPTTPTCSTALSVRGPVVGIIEQARDYCVRDIALVDQRARRAEKQQADNVAAPRLACPFERVRGAAFARASLGCTGRRNACLDIRPHVGTDTACPCGSRAAER